MDIQGKVAIVTGGARGLGKGYGSELLKHGAKVVLTDILVEEGLETETELKIQYGEESVIFVLGDVTKDHVMKAVFETAKDTFGHIDIVINNAGIGAFRSPEITYGVNVFSVFRCTELAITHMSKENGGRGGVVINIASKAGLRIFGGCPMYVSSKHAVAGYSGAIGKQLENKGISGVRVMALCPGFVKTDLTITAQQKEKDGDQLYIKLLEADGGWTEFSDVTNACMTMITKNIPGGSLIVIDGNGMREADMNAMPEHDLDLDNLK